MIILYHIGEIYIFMDIGMLHFGIDEWASFGAMSRKNWT